MGIGYTDIAEYSKTKRSSDWTDFLASLSNEQKNNQTSLGAAGLLMQFKDWQNYKLSQDVTAVKSVAGITSRCAIVNDSDGILFGVYPQNVPISDFHHPTGTTVVGIGSTYFTGSECDVNAGWKYTTSAGFFNPNLPTNDDYLKTLRETRDLLLTQSDWTQSRDVTLSNDNDWKTYRQTLRDLPANTADPSNPTWPTKPS